MYRVRRVVFDVTPGVSSERAPPRNGIARTARELAGALAALTPPTGLDFRFLVRGLRPNLRQLAPQIRRRAVRVPLPRGNFGERVAHSTSLVERASGGHLFHGPANLAPVRCVEKAIITIHDAMFVLRPEAHLHCPREGVQVAAHAHRCAAIVTCSEASKRDIARAFGVPVTKIHVVAWGYDRTTFRPEPDTLALRSRLWARHAIERPFWLAVSCSMGRKRSDVLLDAYLSLGVRPAPPRLVLVWPQAPSAIRAKAARTGGGRVVLIDAVADAQLRDLYCGAQVCWFPSEYEGFGLPVLESMACGTPVVTTNSSSLPEVGGPAAHYLEGTSREELCSAMRAVMRGDLPLEAMAAAGLAQASTFCWQKAARAMARLYRDVDLP